MSLIVLGLVTACNSTERTVFENASGINIPSAAKEKESYDDGKFVKTNHYTLESKELTALVDTHQFIPFKSENIPQFWAYSYLRVKPDYNDLGSLYYKSGSRDTISWFYLAELKSGNLWTEIKYQGKPAY